MKNFASNMLVAALVMGPSLATAATSIEYLPIEHVYTVKGFDSNDNSEVIVEGYLPDLCYQAPTAKSRVIGKKIVIDVTGTRNANPDRICAQMTVPFLTSVSVGTLDKGTYDIIVNGASGTPDTASMQVAESTSSAVDEHVYANVDYVEKVMHEGKIKLNGYNPSDCYELDTIKFISNELDSYAVLPIMEQVRSSCPRKMVPFSYEAEVPTELEREKVLLHVRVMNGKSVNTVYSADMR